MHCEKELKNTPFLKLYDQIVLAYSCVKVKTPTDFADRNFIVMQNQKGIPT